jgi:adenylate kinase
MTDAKTIVFLGKPGSGKSTQAGVLKETLGYQVISTGDLVRSELKADTSRAREMRKIMEAGKLIGDDIIKNLIKDRIEGAENIILEGFPRTLAQAEWLQEIRAPTAVVYMDCDETVILERLSHRWSVKLSEHILSFPSREAAEDFAQKHNGSLYKRTDDKEDIIKTRFAVFIEETIPAVNYYKEKNLLHQIQAEPVIEETAAKILESIGL